MKLNISMLEYQAVEIVQQSILEAHKQSNTLPFEVDSVQVSIERPVEDIDYSLHNYEVAKANKIFCIKMIRGAIAAYNKSKCIVDHNPDGTPFTPTMGLGAAKTFVENYLHID